MKGIFIFSAFIFLMLSCKTQKNLEVKYSDYEARFSRIDEDLEKGFPERADAALDTLIADAKNANKEQIVTLAILRKINIKNLDLEDFAQNQIPYLETELSASIDSTSRSFLAYTLALVNKSIWDSSINLLPNEIEGDSNKDAKWYKDRIDSLMTVAVDNAGIKSLVQSHSPFFKTGTITKEMRLRDFFLAKNIELFKSSTYLNYLGENDQEEKLVSLYDELIANCAELGQWELVLEFEIQKRSFLKKGFEDLVREENDSLRYIVDYYRAKKRYDEAQLLRNDKIEMSKLLVEAMTLFELVESTGDSIYTANAKAYQEGIQTQELQVNMESVLIPGQKSLIYLNYTNIDQVYLKIYKLEQADYIQGKYNRSLPFKTSMEVHSANFQLPEAKYPYVAQSTEIELPVLEAGFYGIAVNTKDEFKRDASAGPLFSGTFLASNYTISHYFDAQEQEFRLSCINRQSGERVEGAKFTLYSRKFRRGNQGDRMTKYAEGLGSPEFSYKPDRNANLVPFVEYDNHYFLLENGLYFNDSKGRKYKTSTIYTDRSIYRPGQELHFFGLTYEVGLDGLPQIFGSSKIEILVSDNFGSQLDNISLDSDEDGSFSGSFTIPEDVQNGNINLRIANSDQTLSGYHGVRVEEYKRPKFKLEFDELETELRLDQNIEMKVNALSFTGQPVRNAKLKYKVYRSTWFPYFYSEYAASYYPSRKSDRTLIKSGEGKSDNQGQAKIVFNAERSKVYPEIKNYSYTIEVEVSDESGESQFLNKVLNISEQAVFVRFLETKQSGEYDITTLNSEGKSISAPVQIRVYEDVSEQFRIERYWPFPDTSILNAGEHKDYSFDSADAMYKELRYDKLLQVKDTLKLNLRTLLGAGTYKVELRAGDEEKITHFVEINDFESQSFGKKDVFYLDKVKNEYLIGDMAKIRIGSNIEDLYIQILKYKRNRLLQNTFVKLNRVLSISELIDSSDYGGHSYLVRTYYKNRVYSKSIDIRVPWKEKEVKITPTSIRYVSEPGAPEKWTFKVTDGKGKPIQGRFLSSMYDASLDQFQNHQWSLNIYPNFTGVQYFNYSTYSQNYLYPSNYAWNRNQPPLIPMRILPDFRFRPQEFGVFDNTYLRRGRMQAVSGLPESDAVMVESMGMNDAAKMEGAPTPPPGSVPPSPPPPPPPPVRTNLSETVYFYPDLKTDEEGNVTIEFINNDALTTWKVQNLAFTKDLAFGFHSAEITTRKDLMIQANQPRFLRSGDQITLAAKCLNLSKLDLTTEAQLTIYDVLNKKTLNLSNAVQRTTISAEGERTIFWDLKIPNDVELVKLTYSLKSEKHNDGEEYLVQVYPNEKFLTASRALLIESNDFSKLTMDEMTSGVKRISSLTIESVGNPAWYALQALPHLSQKEEENAENTFYRYFSNALAAKILEENPLIEDYYSKWIANGDLTSKLKLNAELKNIELKSTPWLKRALSEEEAMQDVAKFFDSKSLRKDLSEAVRKLESLQMSGGGFAWFEGGRASYFISQNILEGIAKLKQLGINDFNNQFTSRLLSYCNREAKKVYEKKGKWVQTSVLKNIWFNQVLTDSKEAEYSQWQARILENLKEKWYEYPILDQALIANIFLPQDKNLALKISQSLLEKSYFKTEFGRFWNMNEGRIYSFWQIGLQAMMIQLFQDLGGYEEEVDEMKFWLINNKRTNSWSTSLATSSAIYALSLGANTSFTAGESLETKIDGVSLEANTIEATNYRKNRITDQAQIAKITEIKFENDNPNKAYANVHLQYFQNYEDIKSESEQHLKIRKEIYLVESDDKLSNVASSALQLGDRIRVRLIIGSDRQQEFIHVTDERPAGAEPVETRSGYKWGRNLTYFQSVKDTKTDFFVESLSKGEYLIEYDMFINNLGVFNSGIAQIQNYYAPEFNDYTKSVRMEVER